MSAILDCKYCLSKETPYLSLPPPLTVDCSRPRGRKDVDALDLAAEQKVGSVTGAETATNRIVKPLLANPPFAELTKSPVYELMRFTTRAVEDEISKKPLWSPMIKSLPSSEFCDDCLLRESKVTPAPEIHAIVNCAPSAAA